MPNPPPPLVPLVVVTSSLSDTARPILELLLAMDEAVSEWCPLTERRPLVYLARHAAVLGGHTTPDARWDHETLFRPPREIAPDSRRIAGFPEPADHVLGEHGGTRLWQKMLQANWASYCDRLPREPRHRYYVEPASYWLPAALSLAAMPFHAVHVVRDPRSELAEQWMSSRRRGVLPKTLTHVDTPLALAEREANASVRQQLADLAKVKTSPEHLRIRYEDVLADAAKAWHSLRAWIGLPPKPAPALPPTSEGWPEARWRSILPESVNVLLGKRMRKELEALGYGL